MPLESNRAQKMEDVGIFQSLGNGEPLQAAPTAIKSRHFVCLWTFCISTTVDIVKK